MIATSLMCLALTVYHESRNQPINGQVVVAKVVLERSKETGNSVCEEAFAYKQFSWANDRAYLENGNIIIPAEYFPTEILNRKRIARLALLKAAYASTGYTRAA